MGNILRGVGETPVQPLGISYIDDYAQSENSALFIGKAAELQHCLHYWLCFRFQKAGHQGNAENLHSIWPAGTAKGGCMIEKKRLVVSLEKSYKFPPLQSGLKDCWSQSIVKKKLSDLA